ncbi:hypothetical protein GPJ56_005032 [Histomonas meleagridis]|uniref:uncharacterized protein n=1 Tax=Histomonas meleagridis TaxID=135588 RepID=UPI00355AB47E|nr:hypothetical protein GPJ56_005032 [Histomonas meleagridis]KAH0802550.1 hypothetical protein GO595_004599 [Histomonas meleagridis]
MLEKYDKFGIIDETFQEQSKGTNSADKIRDILSRESKSRASPQNQIIDLTDINFEQKTNDGRPWIISISNSDHSLNNFNTIFQELIQKTGNLFGFGRIKENQLSIKTLQFLKVHPPQIVILDRSSSNLISRFTGQLTTNSLVSFATKSSSKYITIVKNDEDIVKWRKSNLDHLHVILFSDLEEPPESFLLVSSYCKSNSVFAFASINEQNIINYPRALGSLSIDELPTYIIYRMGNPQDDTFGGPVIPLVIPFELDSGSLSAIIRKFRFTVFSELNTVNFHKLCSDYCIVYVDGNEIADDIKKGINDMNIPTGKINASKEEVFVQKLGLETGDFVVLKPNSNEFMIWKDVTTWMEFRKRYEFLLHGITSFKKVESLPNLTGKSHSTKISFIDINIIIEKIEMTAKVLLGASLSLLKQMPDYVVMIIVLLLLITIGEIIVLLCKCCFGNKRKAKKD